MFNLPKIVTSIPGRSRIRTVLRRDRVLVLAVRLRREHVSSGESALKQSEWVLRALF